MRIVNAELDRRQGANEAKIRRLEEELSASKASSRQLKVNQEKAKFNDPGMKRAVGYLHDQKLDVEDMQKAFVKLFTENGRLAIGVTAENHYDVSVLLTDMFEYLNKTGRKVRREIESYNIARDSPEGWATEKKYRADGTFLDGDDSIQWYEKEEPSKEKKMQALRQAESDVRKERAFRNINKSTPYFIPSGKGPSRWNSNGQSSSSSMFSYQQSVPFQQQGQQLAIQHVPQSSSSSNVAQAFVPPAVAMPPRLPAPSYAPLQSDPTKRGPMLCHKCNLPGHMQKYCPNA